MTFPLISIIVPIYKVEPYLRRCLDSIVNQTYTNLEIILIDDGSPDGCPQICDEYAARDDRIVVIHKENGGLSDARNAGLDICKGEYISFVDSDDWIADVFIEVMFKVLKDNKATMAISDFSRTSQTFSILFSHYDICHVEVLNHIEATKKLWSEYISTFTTVWGVLYKASLFKHIRFPKGRIHEDLYVSFQLLYTSNKTVFIDIPLYFYFYREGSITEKNPDALIRKLEPRYKRYLFFKEQKEAELKELCLKKLCWEFVSAFEDIYINNTEYIGFNDRKKFLLMLKEIIADYKQSCKFTFIQGLFLTFVYNLPHLFIFYRKYIRTSKR